MLDGDRRMSHRYSDREEKRAFCHSPLASKGDGHKQVTTVHLLSPPEKWKGEN